MERHMIHYTELGHARPGTALAIEWETFRRELPRLLAEGHAGKHVVIKGDQVIGLWDTFAEAHREGRRRFPDQPLAVQPVAEWIPFLVCGRGSRWAA